MIASAAGQLDFALRALAAIALPGAAALTMRLLHGIWPGAAAWLGPLALLSAMGSLLSLGLGFSPGGIGFALGAAGSPLELVFRVDGLAVVLGLSALAVTLLFWTRWEDHPDPPGQAMSQLLLASGMLGLAFAADLVTAWLCLELCFFSTCALLMTKGNLRSLAAALSLLRWGGVGSALAALGIGLLLVSSAGSSLPSPEARLNQPSDGPLQTIGFALALIGFGTKAGLFALNPWSTDAERAAPMRLLAIVSGVLPVLVSTTVARTLAGGDLGAAANDALLLIGALAAVVGAAGLWQAQDIPAFFLRLGLAANGMVAIAFSVGGAPGQFAAVALIAHLLVVQTAVFGLAQRWSGAISDLSGLATRMPVTAGVLVLFAASWIGIPPLPGFWAKLMLVIVLAEDGGGLFSVALLAVLTATTLEALAWLRFLRLLYARSRALPEIDASSDRQPGDPQLGDPQPPATPVRADRWFHLLRPHWLDRAYSVVAAALLVTAVPLLGPLTAQLNSIALEVARPAAARNEEVRDFASRVSEVGG